MVTDARGGGQARLIEFVGDFRQRQRLSIMMNGVRSSQQKSRD
jgi:hypothetical protein